MLHLCPTCRRCFEEAGFCPFDGSSLAPATAAEQRTVVSAPMAAQPPSTPPPDDGPPAPGTIRAGPSAAPDGPARELLPARDSRPAGAGRSPARELLPARDSRPAGAGRSQEPAHQAEVHRRTFPPPPTSAVNTEEITSAPTRRGPVPPGAPQAHAASDPPKVRSRSASENPDDALDLDRGSRDNEYDKLVGQTLDGRYYIEHKIGEGGMGVVFSARHAVIERPLAIKVLKRDAMRDTATIRRFVQEAQAASRIGHPNIVDVTDFGTTPDGMTYSVMEFVPGQTLGTAIRFGAPFAPRRAIRITAQIARALAAAHDKGIVHRDLKPENVFLLDRDGRQDFVKIVDFGIAKVTPPSGKPAEPRLTRAGSVFGTPEYMAPEQAAGRGDTDGRVDVYALGVILYEMLCARVPHRGDSMLRTLAMQMLDPIDPPSTVRPDLAIAPDLEAIVMHALAKKREQRYQTMGELLAALEAILPLPVALSVTGSPLYTLAALPPGADPGAVPAPPASPLHPAESGSRPSLLATQPGGEPARASAPTRRIKDEPELTAGDRPRSFQHVFADERVPARARRWPLLLLVALIAGGVAGAVGLTIERRGAGTGRDRDAGVVAIVGDAGAEQALVDAAPVDADLIVLPELDAGRLVRPTLRRDAGPAGPSVPETPNHRGTILVQVLTRPEGASLYDGSHYRGPGGTELEEPLGRKLVITCRHPGYKPGTVEVNFRKGATAVLCVLQRIKVCIDGIKNPFDDCEPAPAQAPGDSDALVDPTGESRRPAGKAVGVPTPYDSASPIEPTGPSGSPKP